MKIDYLPIEKLSSFKRSMKESAVTTEYKGYLNQLKEGQLGKISLDKKDGIKANTVRNRLVRIAKLLGMNLEIRRIGNEVIFYKKI